MSAPPPAESLVDRAPAWRMLAVLAAAELLGMSLWFSATAVTASLVEAFQLTPAATSWLTIAVQAGFVGGTLVTAALNVADVVPARRLMGLGAIAGAAANLAALLVTSPAALLATGSSRGGGAIQRPQCSHRRAPVASGGPRRPAQCAHRPSAPGQVSPPLTASPRPPARPPPRAQARLARRKVRVRSQARADASGA